jgi:hypothetical protein
MVGLENLNQMVINFATAIPLALALAMGTGFVANEWSHGGLSDAFGMGHRHLLDFGGYHCAAHDDPERGPMHASHMHGNGLPVEHAGCRGGSQMHDSTGDRSWMRNGVSAS